MTSLTKLRQDALKWHRRERGALKLANHWSGVDEAENPWWLRNLRIYQNKMVEAASERAKILHTYLETRRSRQEWTR